MDADRHSAPAEPGRTGAPILIAEDDVDDALLLERAFSKANVNVSLRMFPGGQELIDFLNASTLQDKDGNLPCALLLLDLKMPRVDGFQVLEWLRQRPRFQNLVVVVFSGSDHPVDVRRAHALGCRHYLVKPGSLPELVQMARNLASFWHTLETGNPGAASEEASHLFVAAH